MPEGPVLSIHEADLPGTRVRYAACGDGPPLIVVPATVSLIEDWEPLIRFLGRAFRTYFFELPGRGGSTPLPEGFSSKRLARVIGDLADHLGHERFALLGFSFGGILTIRALQALGDRITAVVLLAPCVSKRAVRHTPTERVMVRLVTATFRRSGPQKLLAWFLGNEAVAGLLAWFMMHVGGLETSTSLKERLMSYSRAAVETTAEQFHEVLTTTEEDLAGPYPQPCFFGMSRFDPLLDYELTERFVRENFADVVMETWDWHYHAPPKPLTLEEYIADFSTLLGSDAVGRMLLDKV